MSAVICVDAGMSFNATTAGTFLDPPTAILPPEVLPTSKAPPNATMARKTPKIKRMRLLFGLTSVANRLTSRKLGALAPRRDAPSGHVSIGERPSLRKPEKEREPTCAGSLVAPKNEKGLLAQAARDVAEDVLDLVAENDQDYDHDHRDQDEDKGVLDHTLPFLTVEQSAKLEIKVGQYASFTSLLSISNRTQFHTGPRSNQRILGRGTAKNF